RRLSQAPNNAQQALGTSAVSCTCPLGLRGHLHLKRVFHPSPARTRTLPPDRSTRFIFAPIQVDLEWMHARSGVAYEPLVTAGLLIDRSRFDFEPSMLTKKPIT